ncbi:MAG: Flp pilus assembly protein CpaB [Rubricella sp.]
MRLVFLLVMFVGILLAGGAVYIVNQQFASYEAQLAAARANMTNQAVVETTDVVVINELARYGDVLTPDMLDVVVWPAAVRPDGAFSAPAEIFGDDPENPAERIVLRYTEAGEPITRNKITGFGLEAGIASRLTPGFRAVTIAVDATTGVSGFLTPGDRVDIFWTGRDGDRGSVTRLIAQNMRVIAIDQDASEDRARAEIARTVTVEATQRQSALLTQAQQTGQLALSLRGIEDTEGADEPIDVDLFDLTGREREVEPEPEPEPEVEEPQRTITIRRAGEVETIPAD